MINHYSWCSMEAVSKGQSLFFIRFKNQIKGTFINCIDFKIYN